MKILAVSNLYPPDFLGGYELGCRQVVDALRQGGHEVRVLTSAPRTTPVPSEPHVDRSLVLTDIYNPYYNARSLPMARALHESAAYFVNAFNVHRLLAVLEEYRPDVVYVWNTVGLGGLGLMGCLNHLRVPWVCHLMDMIPAVLCQIGARVIPALAREFERQFQGYYLACSQQLVDEIRSRGIPLKGHVEIVPNWVVGRPAAIRSEYLQGGHLRIVYAGQLLAYKGVGILIEAAHLLLQNGHKNFSLDIYGKLNDDEFPELVRRFQVGGHVTFRGLRPQAELARIHPDYDLFAFPTWEREPFAFSPLEAAACGCVPVLPYVSGNSEWMVDGVHCLKAERSPTAFARVFSDVLDGAIDLERLGRRASAIVRRDFHLEGILPRIERALGEAAREPRSGGGTAAEAYRLALLAEKLTHLLIQDSSLAA